MTKTTPINTELFHDIRGLVSDAKQRATVAVNASLTQLYWQIGHRINQDLLGGERAAYGKQIVATLSQRTAISKQPETLIQQELQRLSQTDQLATDCVLKDPYVLDFLGLQDHYLEKDLEDAILRDLESFLLELGAGFTFVARQKRIHIDNEDFYIDLLLYNRKLRRLVVIDLKIGAFKPHYKGQMELYLRWLDKHERQPEEEPPLGIILCAENRQEQIELLQLDDSGIHIAEYLTELPKRELLHQRLQQAIDHAQQQYVAEPQPCHDQE